MKAMILAAGFGTRFRPATYELPKPLIPLCNRPLIAYAMDALLSAGVDQIIVNLHHLPDALEQYLRGEYGRRVELRFSFEPEILGTGGGIRKVRDWLKDDPFYLTNGDTIQFPPFERMRERFEQEQVIATLLLRHPPPGDRYTSVWFDGKKVTGLGNGSAQPLMFSGTHLISPRIFELLPDRPFSSITEDVYAPVIQAGAASISGVVDDGLWFDIGTPARYMSASDELREISLRGRHALASGSAVAGDSIVAASSRVKGNIEQSILGEDCEVRGEARVTRSALWAGAAVGSDADIRESILGLGVKLPNGSRALNVLVCRRRTNFEYAEGISVGGDFAVTSIDSSRASLFELG